MEKYGRGWQRLQILAAESRRVPHRNARLQTVKKRSTPAAFGRLAVELSV